MKKNKIKWRNPRIDTVDQTECNTKNIEQTCRCDKLATRRYTCKAVIHLMSVNNGEHLTCYI